MVHSTTFSQNDLAAVCGYYLGSDPGRRLVEKRPHGSVPRRGFLSWQKNMNLIREVRGKLMIAIEIRRARVAWPQDRLEDDPQINKNLFLQSILSH